uniref:Uncharacterized protein n=1 Tax=Dinoroseobacter phage vB_DshS_R26L TaxID=3161158 RepID=A0AAU7VGV4_9CAUD
MPRVFIVNEPDESRAPEGRATYDTNPARAFGQIVFINPADQPVPVRDPERAVERAHEVLADASEDDFLVWAGGDPLGLIIAASILADKTDGQFTYLKWDRAARAYAPAPLDLFPDNGEIE